MRFSWKSEITIYNISMNVYLCFNPAAGAPKEHRSRPLSAGGDNAAKSCSTVMDFRTAAAGSGLEQGAQVDLFVLDSELDADMVAVGQNGALGKVQQFGNFLVGFAVAYQLRHL